MPDLYARVDLVVQNAGGSTSLEALAAGVPVVSYRCIPGHGETNAAALDKAGLAPWLRNLDDLRATLADGRAGGGGLYHRPQVRRMQSMPCVATVIAAMLETARATAA